MLVNERDQYVGRSLLLYGEYSEAEVTLFQCLLRQGDVAVEIGANIGAHTVPIAKACGRAGVVFALEPQRLIYQTLCANIALNGLTNVWSMWAASGQAPGALRCPVLDPEQPNNFGAVELGGCERGETVQVLPLDVLKLQRVRLLKVDVEGMEKPVLAGARETIARTKPALYVEADREQKSPELLSFIMRELGYQAWWHFPPLFNPRNFAENEENVFGQTISINVLCMPAEQAQFAEGLLPGCRVLDPAEPWHAAVRRLSEAGAQPRRIRSI